MNEQPSGFEAKNNNPDVVILSSKEIEEISTRLDHVEHLANLVKSGQIRTLSFAFSRNLSPVLEQLRQHNMSQEAARAGSKAALDYLVDDKRKGGEEYLDPGHTLAKTVTYEQFAGVLDECHRKLAEFVGRVYERYGSFEMAADAYRTSYPDKYGEKVRISDSGDFSMFKKMQGTREGKEREKATEQDFNALVQDLASDPIMKIDALAELDRLLAEARKAFEKVKVESA